MDPAAGWNIRPLADADGPAFRTLIQRLAEDGPYLVRMPGERLPGPEELRQILAREAQGGGRTYIADLPEGLVGYCALTRSPWRRRRHVAHLVIGVRRPWQGRGIGAALLDAALAWAPAAGLERIELTMTAGNDRAETLYRSRGFVEEGRKIASVRGFSGFDDELLMALRLSPPI